MELWAPYGCSIARLGDSAGCHLESRDSALPAALFSVLFGYHDLGQQVMEVKV